MNSIDFCFWLQGYFELSTDDGSNAMLTSSQVKAVKNHLDLVFLHEIDPLRESETPVKPNVLNALHGNDKKVRC